MRFISLDEATEGMVLSKSIYGLKGEVLLNQGLTLKQAYIDRISELGYNGIYIKDDFTEKLNVEEPISYPLRMQMVYTLKNAYEKVKQNKQAIDEFQKLKRLVSDMLDELARHKDLMVNSIDIKTKEDYLYFHSVQVSMLSVIIGTELGLNKNELYELGLAGLFHDIGKLLVPNDQLKNHPMKGFQFLKEHNIVPLKSYIGVLNHHENYDGSGYPSQKKGEDIYLYGRIIHVVNMYDNLISNTSSHNQFLPSEAMEYIMGGSSTFFDTKIVGVFTRKIAPYPIGTYVELSNGNLGLVVHNYNDFCMRPKVLILKENQQLLEEPYYVDLKDLNQNGLTIKGIAS